MPRKPAKESPHKLRPDVAEIAFRVMREATGQAPKTVPGQGPKNRLAQERGMAGGLKGGRARADKLSSKQLSEMGKKGAAKRWKGTHDDG